MYLFKDTVPPAKKLKQQVTATVSHQKTQLEHVKVPIKESPRRQSPRKSVRQHDSPQKTIKKEVIGTTPPPNKGEKKQVSRHGNIYKSKHTL